MATYHDQACPAARVSGGWATRRGVLTSHSFDVTWAHGRQSQVKALPFRRKALMTSVLHSVSSSCRRHVYAGSRRVGFGGSASELCFSMFANCEPVSFLKFQPHVPITDSSSPDFLAHFGNSAYGTSHSYLPGLNWPFSSWIYCFARGLFLCGTWGLVRLSLWVLLKLASVTQFPLFVAVALRLFRAVF